MRRSVHFVAFGCFFKRITITSLKSLGQSLVHIIIDNYCHKFETLHIIQMNFRHKIGHVMAGVVSRPPFTTKTMLDRGLFRGKKLVMRQAFAVILRFTVVIPPALHTNLCRK